MRRRRGHRAQLNASCSSPCAHGLLPVRAPCRRAGSEAARRALGQEALDKKLVDAASSAGAMAMALGAVGVVCVCVRACVG